MVVVRRKRALVCLKIALKREIANIWEAFESTAKENTSLKSNRQVRVILN
jgi:hypothetical protein